MADGDAKLGRAGYVEAPINYLADGVEDSIFYTNSPERSHMPLRTEVMRIENVRASRGEVTLERHGVQLIDAPTAVRNFRDREAAFEPHRKEVEAHLLEAFDARRVVLSGNWVYRLAERSAEFGAAGTTYPSRYAHTDYSDESGPATARMILGEDPDAERWMAGRYMVLNLWRALSPPPQDCSLCVCDATTVAAEDLAPSHVAIGPPGQERKLSTNMARYNPAHRWIYFSDMTSDELLVFRGYDSDAAHGRRVPHTAFDDPSAGPNAPPRESIDVRAAVFFG
jgi:hypothetical protein